MCLCVGVEIVQLRSRTGIGFRNKFEENKCLKLRILKKCITNNRKNTLWNVVFQETERNGMMEDHL